MCRQQGLVGGNHRLPELQGRQDHRAGNRSASGQLRHHVHLRVINDALPVRAHDGLRDPVRARLVEGFDGDLADVDSHADARRQEAAIPLERAEHAAAHGAAADHSQVDLLHRIIDCEACRKQEAWTINF